MEKSQPIAVGEFWRPEDEGDSMTVTIALDSPDQQQGPSHQNGLQLGDVDEEVDADFMAIPPPPSHSELLASWYRYPALCVRELSSALLYILELRLNPPACGSMRNWEFLAAHLGLSLDEIVGLRRNENPTRILLRKFGQESLLRFFELVAQAGRVDVLLSVLPFAAQLGQAAEAGIAPPAESPLFDSLISSSNSFASVPRLRPSRSPPRQPFLLVLHHELPQNKNMRRFHRMLLKNLDRYAQDESIKVLDVDQCFDEENLFDSVQRHFERAWQVLLALSADYHESIASELADTAALDQKTQLKRHLHTMTFQEVLFNRGENRRFRVLLMEGTRPEHIPRGWPSNTLHYRFPNDFSALCERLFDRTENGTE